MVFGLTLWMFSAVMALEVLVRVKTTHVPVRATSVPSVTNTFAFLLRVAGEATAATHKKNPKTLNNKLIKLLLYYLYTHSSTFFCVNPDNKIQSMVVLTHG